MNTFSLRHFLAVFGKPRNRILGCQRFRKRLSISTIYSPNVALFSCHLVVPVFAEHVYTSGTTIISHLVYKHESAGLKFSTNFYTLPLRSKFSCTFAVERNRTAETLTCTFFMHALFSFLFFIFIWISQLHSIFAHPIHILRCTYFYIAVSFFLLMWRSLHQTTYIPSHFSFYIRESRVLWRIIMFNYSFITYDNQENKSMMRIVRARRSIPRSGSNSSCSCR